jgi:hypothetical protein
MTMLGPLSIPNLIAGGLSTSRALYIASRSIRYNVPTSFVIEVMQHGIGAGIKIQWFGM